MSRTKKNIRLPNGYGSVVKMNRSGHRRRPYEVRITTGYEYNEKTDKVIQKRAILG